MSPPNMPSRMVAAIAWCLLLMATHGNAQAPTVVLADDSDLSVPLQLDLREPTFEDLVDALEEATQLKMTVDEALGEKIAVFGLSVHGQPAWQLMDDIARTMLIDGRWEKTSKGYHLTGKLRFISDEPPQLRPLPWWRSWNMRIVLSGLSLTLLASGLLIVRRFLQATRGSQDGRPGPKSLPAAGAQPSQGGESH